MKRSSTKQFLYAFALSGIFSLASFSLFAQVKIGNNPTSINSSAALEVESTSKGVLPSRLTSAQRDVITTPATGLIIYNTTENCLQINVGTPASPVWECSSVRGGGDAILRFSDNRNYNYNSSAGYQPYYTTLNSEVVIPYSDYSFTKGFGGTLSVTYSAFIDYTGGPAGAINFQHVEYRLYLDNELVGVQSFEHNALEAATISITAFKSVSAGTHSLQLRAYKLSGNGTSSFSMYQNGYYASIQ